MTVAVEPTVPEEFLPRLETSAPVASVASWLDATPVFTAEHRTILAMALRQQAEDARTGRLDSSPVAAHRFHPPLSSPVVCEQLACRIEQGDAIDHELREALLAFPRAAAAKTLVTPELSPIAEWLIPVDVEEPGPDPAVSSFRSPDIGPLADDGLLPLSDDLEQAIRVAVRTAVARTTTRLPAGLVPLEPEDSAPAVPSPPGPTPFPSVPRKAPHAVKDTYVRQCATAHAARGNLHAYVGGYEMSPRTFGLEIEGFLYTGDRSGVQIHRIRRALDAAGCSDWDIDTDMSIEDDARGAHGGIEVKSPVLRGAEGLAAVSRALSALRRVGFVSNDSCAIHVHMGVLEDSMPKLKALAAALTVQEPALDTFVIPPRRGEANKYALPAGVLKDADLAEDYTPSTADLAGQLWRARTLDGIADVLNVGGRYHKFNYTGRALARQQLMSSGLLRYVTRGTIENRCRDAYFVAPDEVVDWIRLTDRLFTAGLAGQCVLPVHEDALAVYAPILAEAHRPAAEPSHRERAAMNETRHAFPLSAPSAALAVARLRRVAAAPVAPEGAAQLPVAPPVLAPVGP